MEFVVKNIKGKDTSKKITLDSATFGIEPNDHALYLDVKLFLANQRQGTHKAKERGEVKGSTRKIKKQKGTGTARAGDIKNPLFKGGGRVFGPRPRSYSFKLNRKMRSLAKKSALSYVVKNSKLTVIEDFDFEAPKTKQYHEILKNLNVENNKSLMVLKDENKNVYLSSRNLKGVKTVIASSLSTYDLMNAKSVIFTEGAVEVLTEMYK